jgi:hypothetical protein
MPSTRSIGRTLPADWNSLGSSYHLTRFFSGLLIAAGIPVGLVPPEIRDVRFLS